MAAEVDAADEGADRGPADQVGNEPGAFEPAQDAYVRPAAPSARPMRGRSVPWSIRSWNCMDRRHIGDPDKIESGGARDQTPVAA